MKLSAVKPSLEHVKTIRKSTYSKTGTINDFDYIPRLHFPSISEISRCKNSHIPNSVTSLGEECFWCCSSLTSITMLPATPPYVGKEIFDGAPLETVYVADEEAKTLYEAEEPWNTYEIIALTTGIENAQMVEKAAGITGYYYLNGRRISDKQSGSVIVCYSDGSTRKVMLK